MTIPIAELKHSHPQYARVLDMFFLAVTQNRLHHAWLLIGEKGLGKADVVSMLAAIVFCYGQQKDFAAIYNQIRKSGTYPDFIEITPTNNSISISQLREGLNRASLKSGVGGWKALFIHPLDACALSAENVLLKFVEHPPPKTIIFLTAHQEAAVLPTLRSRTICVGLRPQKNSNSNWQQKGSKPVDVFVRLIAGNNAGLTHDLQALGKMPEDSISAEDWLRLIEAIFCQHDNTIAHERLADLLDGPKSAFYRELFLMTFEAIGAQDLIIGDTQGLWNSKISQATTLQHKRNAAKLYHRKILEFQKAIDLNIAFRPLCHRLALEIAQVTIPATQ